jgi:hypothetical protein
MSLVIVTKNQYLLASKIYHITLNEETQYCDVRLPTGKLIGIKDETYHITITYVPDVASQNTRDDVRECVVTMKGKVDAYKIYKDLIRQIREQMPDALFLDKAFESLLGEAELADIAESEKEYNNPFGLEFKDDRSTKKIRKPRKTKRTSKKVFRRAKRSH